MPGTAHHMRHALVVAASAIALAAGTSTADAQRVTPRYGRAVEPESHKPANPYPGGGTVVDQGWRARRPVASRTHQPGVAPGSQVPVVIYVPVPVDQGYYQGGGYVGVTDAMGRPLSLGYEQAQAQAQADAIPAFTPDLSGSPYVIMDGGAMLVDFARGQRRSFPSCAAQDPDGRPRTVFYQNGGRGVVLRTGQRGLVQGEPAAGAKACYEVDSYGRMALRY